MRGSVARRRGAADLRRRTHPVILAGGAGERFWPASRAARPKFFLRLVGTDSLLQQTLARARRLAPAENVWVVCGAEHRAEVRRETQLPVRRVLAEPARRNTAMAVGLAAARVARAQPDAVLAVLPADAVVPDPAAFARELQRAARAADHAGVIVTVGVRPTRVEPGYGHIQVGPEAEGFPGLHHVRRFVEKPEAARARRFLRQGGFLWNAGIFVFRADTMLEELAAHAPALWRRVEPLIRAPARGLSDALERAYRRAPSLPLDVAVVERSKRVWTLPVDFHWSDVGTWQSLAEELGVAADASRAVGARTVLEDAPGNLVWGGGRLVALLGVEGLAVVDAGDAVLVTRLDRAAELRRVVERLRAEGPDLL